MEEKIYLGMQYGMFVNDRGEKVSFRNVFFMEPFTENPNPDYHTYGYKSAKYKLADVELVEGLEPLDSVETYFSSKGVVTKLVKIEGRNLSGSV